MDTIKLVDQAKPEDVKAFACGKCGLVYHSEREADRCHDWKCETCGKSTREFHTLCDEHQAEEAVKRQDERVATVFLTAKKVTFDDYKEGHFFVDGMYEDGYMESLEDLYESCRERGVDVPPFVWGTSKVELSFDAFDIVDRTLEQGEFYDGARDEISPKEVELLQSLLDFWTSRQKLNAFMCDESVAILVPPDPDNEQTPLLLTGNFKCRGCETYYDTTEENLVKCKKTGTLMPQCPECGRTEAKRKP